MYPASERETYFLVMVNSLLTTDTGTALACGGSTPIKEGDSILTTMFLQIFESLEPVHLSTCYKRQHIIITVRTPRHEIIAKVKSGFYHTSIWYVLGLLADKKLIVDELQIKDQSNDFIINREARTW